MAEIAQALDKSEAEIQAACEELLERGVCYGGMEVEVEIADRYWPYEKQRCESGRAGVCDSGSEVAFRRRHACSAGSAQRMNNWLADLQQRGVSLAQVERAIWLGCARKYATLVANDAGPAPISSLSYFRAVIDEVVQEANTSDTYWALHSPEGRDAGTGMAKSGSQTGPVRLEVDRWLPFRGWPTSPEWRPTSPECNRPNEKIKTKRWRRDDGHIPLFP